MTKHVYHAINKGIMQCNKVRRDPSPNHKFVVKACKNGKQKWFILEIQT